MTYSVSGHTVYSSICGRVFACQRGIAAAFSNFHDGVHHRYSLCLRNISHLWITRLQTWTFAAANKQEPNSLTKLTCPCSFKNGVWPHPSLVVTTSMILVTLDQDMLLLPTTLMTPYGMARDMDSTALAVSSTHPHGSASLYLTSPTTNGRFHEHGNIQVTYR